MESILTAYISTLYGTLLFIVVMLRRDKTKLDEAGKKFNWKNYKEQSWDNWLMALVVVPGVVHWAPDLFSFVYEGEWHSGIYAISGFLVEYAYDKYLSKYINNTRI